jgi:hypothetical protein
MLDAAAQSMARGASGVWLRAVSRLGLLCRGTVYLLVGYLALRLALAAHGRTGAPASSAGAVQAADVWGRVPLVLLVAGLGAYALTQLIEAVFRPAHATVVGGRGTPWRRVNGHTKRPETLAEAVARGGSTAGHVQSPAIMPRRRPAGHLFTDQR